MKKDFNDLLDLPGTPSERDRLQERLETLSVRESYVLAAAVTKSPPEDIRDAMECFRFIGRFHIRFPAGNYEELGRLSWQNGQSLPEDVLPYINFDQIGRHYADTSPGLFVGACYVCYPPHDHAAVQREDDPAFDNGWSVKMKLASPAVPEGVWLRLPDYGGKIFDESDEVLLALHELKVRSLEDCTLLDARCIFPEAGDLTKQYHSIRELARDGDDFGYILDGQGPKSPQWAEKFSAALEYENCNTLKFAMDILQNLHCYDWVPCEEMTGFAAKHLHSQWVPPGLIQSGCIDLRGYAENLLQASGYMLNSSKTGYLIRNQKEFTYEHSGRDIMRSFPLLEQISDSASPEDVAFARCTIYEIVEGQVEEGLRKIQAAMEYEDCASMSGLMDILDHFDRYTHIEISDFREKTKQELLEKGLDEKVIDMCFDFEAYAAITHDFEDIYISRGTGLYVHKDAPMLQIEQGGMTMQ